MQRFGLASIVMSENLALIGGSIRPCPNCGSTDRTWEWEHPGVEAYCTITCKACGKRDRFGPI